MSETWARSTEEVKCPYCGAINRLSDLEATLPQGKGRTGEASMKGENRFISADFTTSASATPKEAVMSEPAAALAEPPKVTIQRDKIYFADVWFGDVPEHGWNRVEIRLADLPIPQARAAEEGPAATETQK